MHWRRTFDAIAIRLVNILVFETLFTTKEMKSFCEYSISRSLVLFLFSCYKSVQFVNFNGLRTKIFFGLEYSILLNKFSRYLIILIINGRNYKTDKSN